MIDINSIDERRRHWYREEQFAEQLGNPSTRAIVEGRWQLFAKEIAAWLATHRPHRDAPVAAFDAGCGDGINLVGLHRIFESLGRSVELHGMDYNELRVERARRTGVPASLASGSLETTGHADASLDLVLLNHVLEHIPEKRPVRVELRRILRPGGLFIVGVPNEGCALAKLRNHVLQRSVLRTTDHVHFFTASALRRDLQTAGFEVDRVHGEGFFVPHLRAASLAGRSSGGRRILSGLRRAFPSQAAGLIAIARTPASNGA
jgi:SAM-dependent methyltransferase